MATSAMLKWLTLRECKATPADGAHAPNLNRKLVNQALVALRTCAVLLADPCARLAEARAVRIFLLETGGQARSDCPSLYRLLCA